MTCKDCIHYGVCGCRSYEVEICRYFIDQARCKVLPCKIGDIVYWTDGCTRFFHEVEVTRATYTKEYGWDMSGFTRNQTHRMFNETDIGKIVFLTKEEAEKALAERSGG